MGDCVNREHSLPKSWWGGGKKTQYSDAFHLYPTDGKVNGERSNFPYGECAGGKVLPPQGSIRELGRLGTSTFPGFSGTVFEPDNEYKGDLARTYFYMATAYNSQIGSWTQGNGNQFFAGNSYPVFKTWSLELLLKWHRQDPVSQKEIDRNEAIYKHQHNRNPYIDHPELVEYVWGKKVGVAWTLNATDDPEIVSPVENTIIEIGTTATGFKRSKEVDVKGVALTENINVSVAGTGFSVSPATITAADANKGTKITVSYQSSTVGNAAGQLILKTGSLSAAYTLTAAAVDGLPAGPARNVSESSFEAVWSCITSPTDTYTLDVTRSGTSIAGYPRSVVAGDEHFLVSGLEPETTYSYTVSTATLKSAPVVTTTSAPMPRVQFLFDGKLEFQTQPGIPSEVAEILADIDNIPGDVTVSVTDPFQLSTDKTNWSTTIVLTPGEERFYMRLFGKTEGTYSTTLITTAEDFYDDNTDVDGTIAIPTVEPTFIETFETEISAVYDEREYQGAACRWKTNAYISNGDGDGVSGEVVARMNKSNPGYFIMLEDKANGMGTLTFWAKPWKNTPTEHPEKFTVSVSSDKGVTWEKIGDIPFTTDNPGTHGFCKHSIEINRKGSLRFKLEQDLKARALIDDIALTDYQFSGIGEAMTAEYHSWDAFCRNGMLVLESRAEGTDVATVYSVDGVQRYAGAIPAGQTEIRLPAGLYVVVVRDFSRTVVVK